MRHVSPIVSLNSVCSLSGIIGNKYKEWTIMDVSVASVTTAYNAAHLLPRQIDALLRQSRPLQEIIVVDNCSTDNTLAMLAERYPDVTVIALAENTGAAGGCATGWSYAALQKKHDWVWNFDNDSIPDDYALEALLSGAGELVSDPTVGMLAPLPIHLHTNTYFPPMLWREGIVRPSASVLEQPVWFADIVIASGCLVRKEVIEKVGVTRSEFFMDFFDFEYCLRVRAEGYSIAVIKKCKFAHELGDARTFRFLGFTHTWTEHDPWREYYLSRNITYSVQHLYQTPKTTRFLIRNVLRHAAAIIFFGQHKLTALRYLVHGVRDGLNGKLGINVLPNRVGPSE